MSALLRELVTAAEASLVADTRDLAGLPPELAELARRASAPALAAMVEAALSRAPVIADPAAAWSAGSGPAARGPGVRDRRAALDFALPDAGARGLARSGGGVTAHGSRPGTAAVGGDRRRARTRCALRHARPWAGQLGRGAAVASRRVRHRQRRRACRQPARPALVRRAAGEEYAEPVLGVLSQGPAGLDVEDEERVARWTETLDALDRYRRGDPASSLARLERFSAATWMRSARRLRRRQATPSLAWDYFSAELYALQDAVGSRCATLAAELAAERYARLADAFNRLARRPLPLRRHQAPSRVGATRGARRGSPVLPRARRGARGPGGAAGSGAPARRAGGGAGVPQPIWRRRGRTWRR